MTHNSTHFPEFTDQELLHTALTHRSALNEGVSHSLESNERLEFLGDAVLELCCTNFLYNKLPDQNEGVLTSFRSALVKTTTLAEAATEIGLSDKLLMSRGEKRAGGHLNPSLLANSFEALIGALYLDQGYSAAYQFLDNTLFIKFEYIQENQLHRDYKSTLQENIQSSGQSTPIYVVHSEVGPDHDKSFTVGVVVDGKELATGMGKSKQKAEQAAARAALEKMYQ